MVVRRGGITAVAAVHNTIKKLGTLMREGSETARESAAATLVTICRKGGAEMVVELASIIGIERIIWELMESGTVRARRKASSLLRIVRRWAAGLDGGFLEGRSAVATPSSSSSRVGFCEKIQLCNMGGFHKINGAILMLLLVMVMSQPSHARLLRGSHLCNFDATQQGPDLAFSGGKDVTEGEEAVSKYRPLLLNLLPKGPSPPSGPSKRTNNVGN
ncbi:hypothetical protein DKX38_006747 [Salix brachista]|uniref:Uncharacterized protein n=1 Tax=Salix brachista TaxID=2182728 RepID=A0A5N5N2L8_9ROSI|nr:hypothetical protein DKX38_006747 [Salix brachista]